MAIKIIDHSAKTEWSTLKKQQSPPPIAKKKSQKKILNYSKKVDAFYTATLFLLAKCKYEGWKWRQNFLREHAGCALHSGFSNTDSPRVYRGMLKKYPELKGQIEEAIKRYD